MAGTPADLTVYRDSDVTHDHTYIGNGCPNDLGTGGTSGSITPCETRIVETNDGEEQKNGTYYHFQAATSGSGGAIEADNANASDTFCPLGWQLPYDGTGGDYYDKSKSLLYLSRQYGYTNSLVSTTKATSYPVSFITAGYYSWNYGRLYRQGSHGIYWSPTTKDSKVAYSLHLSTTTYYVQDYNSKSNGFVLRCTLIL